MDDSAEESDPYYELAKLAGSLAHEIKNPLSVIRMNMDLLAEDLDDPETPTERRAMGKIRIVQQQCTRLETLLNDFLRFSSLRDLRLSPGNLNDQVDRVLNLFEVQAAKQEVEINRYLDPDLPHILLDEHTLQAALLNLVKNALEATPPGAQVTAQTQTTTTGVRLVLVDTGTGIDNRTAAKMFEAFYSTKDGGSGLGLPTAQKIITAHGGRIAVQSELGRGTQFIVDFPVPKRLPEET